MRGRRLGAGLRTLAFGLMAAAAVAACGGAVEGPSPGAPGDAAAGARPRVVATTAVLGDVVAEIGGEAIELTVLVPPGIDPHAFEPSPADAMALEDADLIFANGFDLEESLMPLLEARTAAGARVVSASAGITPRAMGGADCEDEGAAEEEEHEEHAVEDHEDEDHADEGAGHDDAHAHGPCAPDPHVWLDPTNVTRWAATIADYLSDVDPEGSAGYAARATGVEERMAELDRWIREQVATVPDGRRRFVADHSSHGWFADRYGLEMVGATLPGFSTLDGASAGELAALEDAIRALEVPAVLVAAGVDDNLARRLAEDTGTPLVPLYTGTLSEAGGPAASYEDMMRHDVKAIVTALGGTSE